MAAGQSFEGLDTLLLLSCFNCHPFSAGGYQIGWLQVLESRLEDAIQLIIIMGRIMMERDEMFHIAQFGKAKGMFNATVTVADSIDIFLGRILGVVDEQI